MATLTSEEKDFLQHWVWESVHFQNPDRPATAMLKAHGRSYIDMAAIVNLLPPTERGYLTEDRPAQRPIWPWTTDEELEQRIREAKAKQG